jgi:hypothetical protein
MTTLKKEDFEPYLTTSFEVMPIGMEPVPIELVQVEDKSSATLDVFSLMFKGGMDNVFHHDTHRVRHDDMGELEIFLGPVHTGTMDAVYYQAIFSAPRGV